MSVRKLTRMMLIVDAAQFLLGLLILFGLHFRFLDYSPLLVDATLCMVLLSTMLTVCSLLSVTRYQKNSYEDMLKALEAQNLKLREQRHDYLNQVQIVYGLLELEEYEEAEQYMKTIFDDITKISRVLKTSKPAVNALLQAKIGAAEQKDIDFALSVHTQLEALPLESWEFCKILSNLIDNAITAVDQEEPEREEYQQREYKQGGRKEGCRKERHIYLRLDENKSRYQVYISNTGPMITPEQKKLLFRPGYTTKTQEGHGMGLAIVSDIVKTCSGSVQVNSDEKQTAFTVTIPKHIR